MADHTSRSHPSISQSPQKSNPHRPLQISHRRVLPILPCADIPSPLHDKNVPPLPGCAPRGSVPRAPEWNSHGYGSHDVPIPCTELPTAVPHAVPEPFPELPRRLFEILHGTRPSHHACMREASRGSQKDQHKEGEKGRRSYDLCCNLITSAAVRILRLVERRA